MSDERNSFADYRNFYTEKLKNTRIFEIQIAGT